MKRDEIRKIVDSYKPFSRISFTLDYIGTLCKSAQDEYWERFEAMNFQSREEVIKYFFG